MPAHKKRNISCGLFAALFCLLLSGAAIAASSPTQQVPNGGKNMSRAALAEKKQLERFGNARSPLEATDPDFAEMRDRLIWGEVAWHGSLDAKMQELITLVVLTASQTLDGFAPHVGAALQVGATPEEIKEAMYQCAPYIGFPKTEKALRLVNEVFREKRIPLPVASQKTVTEDDRFMQGVKVQKSIFGAAIDAMHKSTPQNQRHLLRDMLSAQILLQNFLDAGCPTAEAPAAPLSDPVERGGLSHRTSRWSGARPSPVLSTCARTVWGVSCGHTCLT